MVKRYYRNLVSDEELNYIYNLHLEALELERHEQRQEIKRDGLINAIRLVALVLFTLSGVSAILLASIDFTFTLIAIIIGTFTLLSLLTTARILELLNEINNKI